MDSLIQFWAKACGYFLYCLPRWAQLWLGNLLGTLIYYTCTRARKTAELNFAQAFGFVSHETIKACFSHFGKCILEVLQIPIGVAKLGFIRFENEELMVSHHQQGKGSILISAHFGNWELVGSLSQFGLPIYGLYREQKQAQGLIYWLRKQTGMIPLDVQKSLKGAIKALKDGKILGIVGDQFREKEFSFFGSDTHFPLGAARLACQMNCPLFFVTCERQGQDLVIQVHDTLLPDATLTSENRVHDLVIRYIELLENRIRSSPEQYLWMRDCWENYRKQLTKSANKRVN